ncbi:MAG: hypothetical protein UU87_C0002G0052 [Parcubacteria group bacterium GW2011_GWA2_42_11]|nr:MAG: hypothetical protein UU87_C0002G0052 [Parcubacteria group bacterium GW2011_GWA2_42_11]KKT76781.1 MAG: hypothetical protein UW72_C0001G0022 [Parcubacteria group bacterium GW2011_GWF2_44_7]
MEDLFGLYINFLNWFFNSAWIWLPFVLGGVFFNLWIYYIQRAYWQSFDWVMLEIKPPKEILETPKNMENIFAGVWSAVGSVGTKYKKYVLGMLQDYFSFEIVGLNGEVHFYLRVLKKYRDLVEAQFYSQYPHAEIKETEDYISGIPSDIPNKSWDFWATKVKLEKDSVYPIRTYPQFMDKTKLGDVFLDPLAGFMEIMGKLKFGEQIWIQLIFRPMPESWAKAEAQEHIAKLAGKPAAAKKEGAFAQDWRTWKESIAGVSKELVTNKAAVSATAKPAAEAPASKMMFLTAGEKDIITAIEEKISKRVFETKLQWAYIARREIFSQANVTAVNGLFNQFTTLNLNNFKNDAQSATKADYALTAYRKAYKQRKMIKTLRTRSFWEKGFVLNTEELATVYHLPTEQVRSPITPFIEAKKGSAPVGLPVE